MRKRWARCLFFLFTTILSVTTMSNAGLSARELAPHLYKTTLDNGLTVLVQETPGTKAATVQIWVKAGSVYEEPREAGITHFIEHMIFKGTPTRGPGALAEAIEAVGGRINAYTSFESTVYHATLSSRYWGLALEVLVDAVRNSIFDPLEVEREKKVVLEEVGMRNDKPDIKLYQELLGRAYTVHPYRLPVIGTAESIAAFNREAILAYMQKHYRPQNFMVVVVGDVSEAEVLAKVGGLLGDLARGDAAANHLPPEPVQEQARHFVVEADVKQPQMAIALPIGPFASPDTPVLDVLAHILGQGETSRLYRSLRDDLQLVYAIEGSAFTPHDPGLLEIFAVLDGSKMAAGIEAALVELFKLKYHSVTEEELSRAKLNLESDFVFNLERVEGLARVLGSFELMAGDPREDAYLAAVRAVTADDIKQVAARYFSGKKVTAGFLVPGSSGFALTDNELAGIINRAEAAAQQSDEAAGMAPEAFLPGTYRFTLSNGIVVLVREDETVATVGIRALFPGGLRAETPANNGAFTFVSELLPKGTTTKSAQEIAKTVANMAGNLGGFTGKNTFGLKADFLARFTDEGLALLADILRHPAFSVEEAGKIRPELLSRLKQQEDSLTGLAFREFNRLLFAGHPYGLNSAGSEPVIQGLTPEALRAIFQRHARPDKMVLAVAGAVKAGEVRALAEKLFGDWQMPAEAETGAGFSESILAPAPPAAPQLFNLAREKEQVHLVLGFLGATLNSEDRYSLEVLDTVLSGQSGRLFAELRDKQSLAYSLSSFSMLGLDTGSFGIYIGTSPDKKAQAIEEVWQQLKQVRQERISEEELRRAKNILISQYELGLQTHSAQALEMALNEAYKLGQDFGTRYVERINAVDAEAVRAAAEKYILPDQYVMVAVGAGVENKD